MSERHTDCYGLSWQCKQCGWWWDGKIGKVAHIRKRQHYTGKTYNRILADFFIKYRDGERVD